MSRDCPSGGGGGGGSRACHKVNHLSFLVIYIINLFFLESSVERKVTCPGNVPLVAVAKDAAK